MVFSSPIFLFLFLPLVLACYFAVPRRAKNGVLLFSSLLFYAWGETFFVGVMLLSIAANYLFGMAIHNNRDQPAARLYLGLGIAANIGLLASFKYANFLVDNVNVGLSGLGMAPIALDPVHLPIGISFFTFQAMSYVVDVYRDDAPMRRNPFHVALYIALFPQLIAGPIVRYRQVAEQIVSRVTSLDDFAWGVRRFVIGLGKKVLLANPLGAVADQVFAIPTGDLTTGLAWLGIASYTLQIYFDFSGYSDMAIGLGRMFGFHFLENFNYPYISRSIREFWRRWHISLSTWFRDYLYIPLGGNRKTGTRTHINLLLVFFLCGLWHGASWNFVIWGMLHGLFLITERGFFGRLLDRTWAPVRHLYVLLVVMVAWVFFRIEALPDAIAFVSAMAGLGHGAGTVHHAALYLNNEVIVCLAFGIIGATPVMSWLGSWHERRLQAAPAGDAIALAVEGTTFFALLFVLVASAASLAAGTYNPFIYFRF